MTTSQPHHIRIFLSSPSDVSDERGLALKVLETLPYDPLLRGKITIEVVAWDKLGAGTPLLATMTPQEAINQGLSLPSECNIVIVIFWSRMGTPLSAKYLKPDKTRYLSGTEWEYLDAIAGSKASPQGLPYVVVYRRTEDPIISQNDPEFDSKRKQWKRVEAFFQAFENHDGSSQGYNLYKTPDDFRELLENHLKGLINHLLDSASVQQGPTSIPLWKGSPFLGLRAFTPDDAPIFFGRGRETDDLIVRLVDPTCRFVAVVGASGSGKSSLVGAGLIPRLIAGALKGSQDWLVVRFTPGELGNDPFLALAAALAREVRPLRHNRPRDLTARLTAKPETWEALIEQALGDLPEWAELLLFIDQFEELFTLTAEAQRLPFVHMLKTVLSLPRLRIVATLRADFYHYCVDYQDLTDILRNGSYTLAAPRSGALYEMIEKPANRAGLEFDPGLAQRIVDDAGSDSGTLALLAYLLDELYQMCIQDGGSRLSFANYERLGGVQGAIGTRAQHVFDQLDVETQAALPGVFRELMSVDDDFKATRQRISLDRLTNGSTDSAAAKLITALTDARLLVQNEGAGDYPIVEVAHEALLRSWPSLVLWIAYAQEDLILLRQVRNATALWERHENSKAFLWPHERLQQVPGMLERLKPILNESEQHFIRPEWEWLTEELNNSTVTHFQRSQIGDRLSGIGDKRPGVGLRPDGLPDIAWCDVPRGTVRLTNDPLVLRVEPFKIAKYPVTYLQYKAFLTVQDGYQNEQWWSGLVHASHWGEQYRPMDNHPAENVSWYDAMAFCRWLTVMMGFDIRLPTEWEWQQAATGGHSDNIYPWGSKWESDRVNTHECGLGRTTAVGLYPRGATSELEILDMSGNVEEWCLNSYGNPTSQDYLSMKNINKRRTVRGGSWQSSQNVARVGFRDGVELDGRRSNLGFRLAIPVPVYTIPVSPE